jgi:putative phage-type endonuclease
MDEAFFSDMSMLDASAWSDTRTERPDDEPRDEPAWVDRPGPDESPFFLDTGARSSSRSEWLAARRTGIGGSEIAAVLGESRWGDAGTVYASKVAPSPDESHEWLEWGLRQEPVILEAYASSRYAHRPRTDRDGRLLRSKEHPWALCTLDGWTHRDGVRIPLELKCDRWGQDWDDGVPAHYVLQLHHQMLVTGTQCASIACLIGGSKLVWADVERDERLIRKIIHAGEAFWARVEARDMPDTTDHKALASVFANEVPAEVDLSGVKWIQADAHLCEALEVAKRARIEADAIKARIKRAMGTRTAARLDDGTVYRWTKNSAGKRTLRRKEVVM